MKLVVSKRQDKYRGTQLRQGDKFNGYGDRFRGTQLRYGDKFRGTQHQILR